MNQNLLQNFMLVYEIIDKRKKKKFERKLREYLKGIVKKNE